MSTVKLVIESDLSNVDNAFTKNQKIINDTNDEVQKFGRVTKRSANIATEEMSQFDKEAKQGTRDLKELNRAAASAGREGSRGIQNLSTQTRKYTADVKQANKETSLLKEQTMSASETIASAFSGAAVAGFIGKIVNTRAEFQKFEAVLTNTLGSKSLAQNALMMIQDVAAKTPFSVQELTASFVKLANSGFKPTSAEIVKLGDLAASQGKSFDQLTEGIIDAQTGEFERLKEFGIRASKEGDNVKFTFKGVETQVKNNSDAIQDYVLSLGELEGVAGGMAAISDTLGGKISNLGDNFDAFFNNLGAASEGVFGSILDGLNDFLGKANQATGLLNQMSKTLKGTSGELTFIDNLKGASKDLLPLQVTLNKINELSQKVTSAGGFVPIYQALGNSIKSLQKQYESGVISVEDFNRKVILINAQVQSVKDQQKAIAADQKAEDEKKKTADAKSAKEAAERGKKEREKELKEKRQAQAESLNEDRKLIKQTRDDKIFADNENEERRKKQIEQSIKDADELFEALSKKQDEQADKDLKKLEGRIKAREELYKKYPLTRIFKVDDPAEVQKLLESLEKLGDEVLNLLEDQVDRTLEANKKEIDASKEKQAEYQKEKEALENKLNEENQLKEEGYANDSNRIKREIAARDEQIAAEKKREAELLEERKKAQKVKLAIDSATQISNIVTAGSTLFAEGAFKGPPGIIAAAATIIGMLASMAALRQQIKAQQDGFAEGGYTGDGGKYTEAGVVHRGEYVITKEKTAKNRALLDGLHNDNPVLIQRGIFDLLKNTGVKLPESDNLNRKRALINEAIYTKSNNSALNLSKIENELSQIKAKFDDIIKNQNKEIYTKPNGDIVKKSGSHTVTFKKNDR